MSTQDGTKDEKREVRKSLSALRRTLSKEKKLELDCEIGMRVLTLKEYMTAKTLLCYVSTKDEIDTISIITAALANSKTVAVPKTNTALNTIDFYIIKSLDDLEIANYNISEPKKSCKKLEDFSQSICITPALGYDINGYRMGYGKGFYDRFLCTYNGISAGLSYEKCVTSSLPKEDFDIPVNILITPKYVRICN